MLTLHERPDQRSVDSLEQEALGLMSEIGARFGRLLPVLRDLDTAEVASADACRTMVEWVASRFDVGVDTARDLVFVARAADSDMEEALVEGTVSWERAVATIRLQKAGAPPDVVARSFGYTLAAVDRATDLYRRVPAGEDRSADRYLVIQPSLTDGVWRLWGQVPSVDGETIEAALTTRADHLPPSPHPEPRSARMADALTSLCLDTLGGARPDGPDPARLTADVFVDATIAAPSRGEAGARVVAGPRVGGRAGRLAAGDRPPYPAGSAGGGPFPHFVGDKTAARAAVLRRDHERCTVDGCGSRYRLQPHHITPYARGGSHHPDNLATLCWYHHHVVIHTLGYRIDPASPPGRRRLQPPP